MFKILEKSLANGAQCADLYYLQRSQESITFEGGVLQGILSRDISGLTLQVKKNGRSGVVSASNLDQEDEILQFALDASQEGEILEHDLRHPQPLPELHLTNDQIWERSYEEYVADGEKAIKMVHQYDPDIHVSLAFNRQRDVKTYLNTYGCEYVSANDGVSLFLGGTLVEAQNILEMSEVVGLRSNDYNLEAVVHSLIEKLKKGRIPASLNSGKMPVLLTPNAIAQLTIALSSGLSGDHVRFGISPLKDRIGDQVLSEKITLIDDMTLPEGGDSFAIDDEGTPAQRTVLFEQGILRNYLLSLKSAHALGMTPNGKAHRRQLWFPRDYAVAPSPNSSNWIILPGTASLEEMIADIRDGIVIDSMFGLVMGNLVQGAIDSDIDMGFKIEHGKIVGRVKGASIGINVYDALREHVVAVENMQHHANALGQSTMLFPHILLKDINITA